MARNKGSFNFAANFEVLKKAPLDARMLVGLYEDLINPLTWQDSDSLVWLFNGAMVVVTTDPSSGVYWLKDADNYTDYASWIPVGMAEPFDPTEIYQYIDGSLATRDSSISDLYSRIQIIDSSIEYLINWNSSIDASLIRIDGSLNVIFSHLDVLDSSIERIDSSLNSLFVGYPFLSEASLGDGLVWNPATGLLDVSVGAEFTGDVSTSHVFFDSTLDPALAMPNPVGGIPAGTTVADLTGDSLTSILNDLLFPTQYPTLTNPSATIAVAPTTLLYEVSANVTLTFTSTLNRGSINPQYDADSPFRSGLPNYFDFSGTGPGLVDIASTDSPYISPTFDASIPLGSYTWNVAISYDEGVQPFDSKGNPYDASLATGTTPSSNTITIRGVYPLFATTVDIATMTKQALVVMTTSGPITLSMVPESGGNRQSFEIPDAWIGAPTNNPLTGVKTFNSVSQTYEYEGGSKATSLTSWTTSSTTETIQGTVVNYTKYTYNGTERSSISIQLEF